MASKKLSDLFALPFLRTYNSGSRSFISLAKVHTFLGYNFYSRLNNIYLNLIESIAKKNYKYLSQCLQQGLASQIYKQLKTVEDGKFKFRIHLPKSKIQAPKPKMKILTVRQNIWNNNVTRIGLQCNVYFGEKFDRTNPLKLNKDQDNKVVDTGKVYRIGQFRYVRWYPELGIIGNIRNMYKEQTFQLLIKYASKMYLQIQHFDQIEKSTSSEGKDQEIISQLVLRTGNQKFDWIIIDINNMREKQNKKQRQN